ncbi:MAG: RIP metalloprotease RseP, partial [Gemmatimonadales bacterium]
IAAKAMGIQVLRFSLGFGRPLLSWQRGETEYWVCWIPLGGYVKMAGLDEEGGVGALEGGAAAVPIDPSRTFDSKPLWRRVIVIVAGVTMNAVLAYCIFTGIAVAWGRAELATTQVDTVLADGLPPGAAALSALRHDDRIVAVNGDTVSTWDAVRYRILRAEAPVRVEVGGRAEPILVDIAATDSAERERAFSAVVPKLPPMVGQVVSGQAGRSGGLRGGDVVVRIDGDTVRSFLKFFRQVRQSPGRELAVTVLRDGKLVDLRLTPERRESRVGDSTVVSGYVGVTAETPTVYVRQGLGAGLAQGWRQTVRASGLILFALKGFFTGELSLRELGGPLLVGDLAVQAARQGLDIYLSFMAMFSINLAILNLLPIPVLDGGHLFFMLVEAVRRKPLSQAARLRFTQVGLFLLIGIMLLAVGNDILRFVSDLFGSRGR